MCQTSSTKISHLTLWEHSSISLNSVVVKLIACTFMPNLNKPKQKVKHLKPSLSELHWLIFTCWHLFLNKDYFYNCILAMWNMVEMRVCIWTEYTANQFYVDSTHLEHRQMAGHLRSVSVEYCKRSQSRNRISKPHKHKFPEAFSAHLLRNNHH